MGTYRHGCSFDIGCFHAGNLRLDRLALFFSGNTADTRYERIIKEGKEFNVLTFSVHICLCMSVIKVNNTGKGNIFFKYLAL